MTQSVGNPAHHSKAIPINNNITIGGAKPVELASPVAVGNSAAVTESIVSTAAAAVARGRFVEDRVPEFDWTLYLKHSKLKAVPHSAFKHVSVVISDFLKESRLFIIRDDWTRKLSGQGSCNCAKCGSPQVDELIFGSCKV